MEKSTVKRIANSVVGGNPYDIKVVLLKYYYNWFMNGVKYYNDGKPFYAFRLLKEISEDWNSMVPYFNKEFGKIFHYYEFRNMLKSLSKELEVFVNDFIDLYERGK